MAKKQYPMRVLLEEPLKGSRRVLRKSMSLPNNFRLRPFNVGKSDNDYLCGLCGLELDIYVNPVELEELVMECPRCGALNEKP